MKNKMLLIAVFLILGCTHIHKENLINYSIPNENITIKNAVIIHNGNPIIEVRTEGKIVGTKPQYKKLIAYYYSENRDIVIFPDLSGSKGDYLSWCFDVKISTDGKFVYYTSPGLLFDTIYKYSIEKGTINKVKSNWHQRLF